MSVNYYATDSNNNKHIERAAACFYKIRDGYSPEHYTLLPDGVIWKSADVYTGPENFKDLNIDERRFRESFLDAIKNSMFKELYLNLGENWNVQGATASVNAGLPKNQFMLGLYLIRIIYEFYGSLRLFASLRDDHVKIDTALLMACTCGLLLRPPNCNNVQAYFSMGHAVIDLSSMRISSYLHLLKCGLPNEGSGDIFNLNITPFSFVQRYLSCAAHDDAPKSPELVKVFGDIRRRALNSTLYYEHVLELARGLDNEY